MMTIAPGGGFSAGQIQDYFDQELVRDDYYSEQHRVVGEWLGKGAAALQLGDEVKREDFAALLQGINPHSGEVLVQSHAGNRRAGWEVQFSTPKSVSIQALVGGDHRLIEAHERAVKLAVEEAEKFALARRHRGQEWVVSGNIVAAKFTHLAARPSSGGTIDPQLHSHLVVINATERPDRQWRALDPREIYVSQNFGSAVYLSALARDVQQLGYRIHLTDGNYAAWELEGYCREQIMAFSNRRKDIEEQMARLGISGPRAAQIAALNTRSPKIKLDDAELRANWQKRAATLGINTGAIMKIALNRVPDAPPDVSDRAVEFARRHGTDREAVLDRRQLEAAALRHAMGGITLRQVRGGIDRQERQGTLIRAALSSHEHPQGAFTTDEMVRLESENLAIRRAGISQAEPIATAEEVQEWAARRGLSSEQTNAALVALTSRDWMSAIEGLAGTAKTYTIGAVREFAEAHGYTVRAFAMTSNAVKELRKVGFDARTVASLTSNPLPQTHRPQLWFIDESSLLATRPVNDVLKIARQEGVALVRTVGDQQQHLAIEAGHPMRQFLDDGMPVVELKTIVRQQDPKLREAVTQASQGKVGAAARAIDLLDEQQRLHEIPDLKERYQRIAEDYGRGHQLGQQTLVVSPGNDERRDLNRLIRDALVERGHVQARGRAHDILVPREDMTRSKIAHARYYDERDVVHFDRAHKRQGIAKDSYLTVRSVDRRGNLLTLEYPNGRSIDISPARWGKAVQVYKHEQREIAVGDRLEYRIHDRKRDIANHQLATVLRLDGNEATVKFDSGRILKGPLSPHIDHGYCSTSHSAQGATVDRVIVNLDSMRSAQLVNQRSFYVTISRAREDARVYTDDAHALRSAVKRQQKKEIALEAIQPQQSLTQPTGIRI
jgi:conjugative relaxase-like TrwC/TraI family protein